MNQQIYQAKYKIIEKIEYKAFCMINKFLLENYTNFINYVKSQIDNESLIKFISRQKEGRSKSYKYTIKTCIKKYILDKSNKPSKNLIYKKELFMRLISSPIFKPALERFINIELTRWLTNKKIKFIPFYSPISSDYAILINDKKLKEFSYDGYIIHIDAKTIMSASNLDDALSNKSLGRFQANWNEISYKPPFLEKKIEEQNDTNIKNYLNIKYSVLPNEIIVNNKKYLSITIFIVDLISLKPELINETIDKINSNSFEHFMFSVCVPNGFLKNKYYDNFFKYATKGGYITEDKSKNVKMPKDIRITCNFENFLLKFEYLENEPLRFKYFIPDNLNKDKLQAVIVKDKNKIKKKLGIKNFEIIKNK